jgi:hypothetical protein
VMPGTLSQLTVGSPPGSTFWLAPGTHRLGGAGPTDQVIPKDGNVYIGAPGAIIDGGGVARYAFTGKASNVTIRYLTIQRFGAVGGNNNEGVVNHDAGTGWTVEFNTVRDNAGAGVFLGSDNVVRYNCLSGNGQYGFSMYVPPPAGGANAITNITLDHNEVTGNNTYDWEAKIAGCGCSGGGKFWDVGSARVTNNWVHHNRGVGLWADTNNVDFLIEGNYIEENDAAGFFYEISYNAVVRNNTFKRNAIKQGLASQSRGDSFPLGAIYLSEAGGDPRVASPVTGTANLEITGNTFVDNWDGVVLWENADRFFNSPANTSGTSYVPKGGVASTTTCNDPAAGGSINSEPALSDCRWKTKNVKVTGNSFTFDPAAVACTGGLCGRNAMFSQYGTYPSWSPYKAWAVSDAITFAHGNVWSSNTYTGPWQLMVHNTGRTVSPSTWQSAPYDQDAGSTFTTGGPAPTTPTTTGPTTTGPTTMAPTTMAPTTTTITAITTTGPGTAPTTSVPAGGNHLSTDTATFEGSSGSWVPWFSTSVARSTLQARSGVASGRVDVTTPYGWGAQLNSWPGFAATAGPKTIGFWGRLGSGNLGATMTVRWRNDAGSDLQVDRVTILQLTTNWEQATTPVTAPTGTTKVWVELTHAKGQPGDHLYIDDLRVAPSSNHLDTHTADVEGSIGRWTPWYSAQIARSMLHARSGVASARIAITSPYGWGVQLNNWPGVVATPGAKTIGFWSRRGSGSNLGVTMTVRWRNQAGADLQIEQLTIPDLGDDWEQASMSVTAPPGTARLWVELSHASGGDGDSLFIDGVDVGS